MDDSVNETLNQILDYIGGCEDFRNNAQLRTYLERLMIKTEPVAEVPCSEGLCCTICGEVKETFSEIVYSQGSRVCLDCKKITQASDDAAFDRDMRFRS